jgi:hypothetical protein
MSNYSSDTLLIMYKCMKYEMGKYCFVSKQAIDVKLQ